MGRWLKKSIKEKAKATKAKVEKIKSKVKGKVKKDEAQHP